MTGRRVLDLFLVAGDDVPFALGARPGFGLVGEEL